MIISCIEEDLKLLQWSRPLMVIKRMQVSGSWIPPPSSICHLDEEDGPELGPGLGLAQRPVARQMCPLDGEDAVSDAHQQHPRPEPQDLRGGQQQEGCEAGNNGDIT